MSGEWPRAIATAGIWLSVALAAAGARPLAPFAPPAYFTLLVVMSVGATLTTIVIWLVGARRVDQPKGFDVIPHATVTQTQG